MTQIANQDREDFVRSVVTKYLLPIMNTKGRDVTEAVQSSSAVANFQDAAEAVGLPDKVDRFVVWTVYFTKHLQAIRAWISSRRVESEALEGRLADAINYLLLLWMMLVEEGVVPDPRKVSVDGA